LQTLGQSDVVVVQDVSSGSFELTPQYSPVGQSSGSSQPMVKSPEHDPPPGETQLGPPTLERQHTWPVARSHWLDPHVT
jgi:hypothetical protein